ncbi:MAG: ArsR/SmtB family transcription factor [Candidatus Eiseniibacteriota bacterium]
MLNHMVNQTVPLLDATFSALADPIRRSMLERLAQGPSTPGTLAEPLAISLPAVSRHLRVLERAGLISRRRHGRRHWLTLDPRRLEEVGEWVAHYRAFWERQLDALERYLAEPTHLEETPWRSRKAPASRSRSGARSHTRAKRSSRRGPTRGR